MDIIRFPDPYLLTREFLAASTGAPVHSALPAGYAATSGLQVVVTDTGGAGVYDVIYEAARITIDVWAPTRAMASEVARTVYGLLRHWQYHDTRVYWQGTVTRPSYYPDETRVPRYTLTVTLGFRGELVTVAPNVGTIS